MTGHCGKRIALLLLVAISLSLTASDRAGAQGQPPGPIKISVDATHAPQRILHAKLEIPATPGPLTLY